MRCRHRLVYAQIKANSKGKEKGLKHSFFTWLFMETNLKDGTRNTATAQSPIRWQQCFSGFSVTLRTKFYGSIIKYRRHTFSSKAD
jgi:hypothetical protein